MPSPGADSNLLFGLLGLQNGFVSREDLVAAVSVWLEDKSRNLGEILRARKSLGQDEYELLTALVRKHLDKHGSAEASLAALSDLDSAEDELRRLGDSELEATLSIVSRRPAADDNERTLAVGDRAAGGQRYRVLRPHAKGGLGEVFVAQDIELHREVALKEIQAHHADNPDSRARFVLEAEITGGLEHPGIVPVYGLGQYADGRPFYAMRFIRGDSLKEAVDRFHSSRHAPRAEAGGTRSLPATFDSVEFRKLLGRFIDVCEAIEYAHSRGVLHRDLKPGNIMLGKYGETLVVDWGLAKPVASRERKRPESGEAAHHDERTLRPASASGSSATQIGSAVGTPAFMSPEQAAGRLDQLGPASDVYSLGATLYYVLTGIAPFGKEDLTDTLRKVQSGDFPSPRAQCPALPRPLEAICLKAMSLVPEDRYLSPAALADDVEKWLADEPISALRETFSTSAARWTRRHKQLSIAALAIAIIVPLALGIGLYQARKGQFEAQSARELAELREHASNVMFAKHSLDVGDLRTAELALGRTEKERRDWEYDHLSHRLPRFREVDPVTRWEQAGEKVRLGLPVGAERVFSPSQGALAHRDVAMDVQGENVFAWDIKRREKVQQFSLPKSGGFFRRYETGANLSLSPDGKMLAVGVGGSLCIFAWDNAAVVKNLDFDGNILCAEFSPDGSLLCVGFDSASREEGGEFRRIAEAMVVALKTDDWSEQWRSSEVGNEFLLFTACGDLLISAKDQEATVTNSNTGEVQYRRSKFPGDEEYHHRDVTSLALSSDEETFVVGTAEGRIAAFELETGIETHAFADLKSPIIRHEEWTWSIQGEETPRKKIEPVLGRISAITPLRQTPYVLVGSESGDLWICDVEKGTVQDHYSYRPVERLSQCTDSKSIVLTTPEGGVVLADADFWAKPRRRSFHIGDGGRAINISHQGDRIVLEQQYKLKLFDIEKQTLIWEQDALLTHQTAFSFDGTKIMVLAERAQVLDAANGKTMFESESLNRVTRETQEQNSRKTTFTSVKYDTKCALIDSSGTFLFIGGNDLSAWNVSDKGVLSRWDPSDWNVEAFALTRDGREIVCCVDRTVYKLSVPNLKVTATMPLHRGIPADLSLFSAVQAVSPDGNIVQEIGDRLVVRGFPSGKRLCEFEHDGKCTCIDFHPSGRRVATGGDDGVLNLWHYPSGQRMLSLQHGHKTIRTIRFSEDGRRLVSVDAEGAVMIWE